MATEMARFPPAVLFLLVLLVRGAKAKAQSDKMTIPF